METATYTVHRTVPRLSGREWYAVGGVWHEAAPGPLGRGRLGLPVD